MKRRHSKFVHESPRLSPSGLEAESSVGRAPLHGMPAPYQPGQRERSSAPPPPKSRKKR